MGGGGLDPEITPVAAFDGMRSRVRRGCSAVGGEEDVRSGRTLVTIIGFVSGRQTINQRAYKSVRRDSGGFLFGDDRERSRKDNGVISGNVRF